MPVQIGAPQDHSFASPLQLLSDCHRRIEHFLGVLSRVVAQAGANLMPDESQALETTLRYFKEAAPRHTEDEEVSLFPRLAAVDDPAVQAVLIRIEELRADHDRADAMHNTVEQIGRTWLAGATINFQDRAAFQRTINDLKMLYSSHIQMEDTVIFPLASRILSGDVQALIGKEMAERRGDSRAIKRDC